MLLCGHCQLHNLTNWCCLNNLRVVFAVIDISHAHVHSLNIVWCAGINVVCDCSELINAIKWEREKYYFILIRIQNCSFHLCDCVSVDSHLANDWSINLHFHSIVIIINMDFALFTSWFPFRLQCQVQFINIFSSFCLFCSSFPSLNISFIIILRIAAQFNLLLFVFFLRLHSFRKWFSSASVPTWSDNCHTEKLIRNEMRREEIFCILWFRGNR